MTATAVWCCSQCGAIYHKDYPRCPNDGAEIVLEHSDPLVGKQIDHYVIDKVLGEGGMGRVYAAHHAQLPDKHFAIKVLLGDVAATMSMRKRFNKEAEIASRLDHPNLVRVVDIGMTSSGLPYIAMDLVEGTLLTDLLDQGPMPPARVVALARAICEGLAYAHDAGLIHRDLKPDNVIVAAGDVPRLTDFGLVLTTEHDQERLTSTGMAMGTPAYAAPEQMAGKAVDHRVDLFALGLTMFEMLTGGLLPWEGVPMEIAAAKAHRDAPTIRERCPEVAVPGDLDALVMRLLARHPSARPNTAREVIEQLDALRFEDAPVVAPAPAHRSDLPYWIAGAAMIAIAGAIAWKMTRPAAPPAVAAAAAPARAPAPPPPVEDPAVVIDTPPGRLPASAPTIDSARAVKPPPSHPAPSHHRHHHADPPLQQVAAQPVEAPAPVAPPLPPPAPPASEPVPAPVELHAAIAGVEVHGALPAGDVERAVRRALPALEHCVPKTSQTVTVELTIGESKRAQNVRASGGGASTCVASALGNVRTEAAPDVGDVDVTVRVAFAEMK